MPSAPKKNNIIRLVGEQAEAFDQQMDADRNWFESSTDAFYFRPEIEGEFDEYVIAGAAPPYVIAEVSTPEGNGELPLGWVCVVDIGRYIEKSEAPTGFRFRVRTSPPINGEVRESLIEGVCQYVNRIPFVKEQAKIALLGKHSPRSRGKGFGS